MKRLGWSTSVTSMDLLLELSLSLSSLVCWELNQLSLCLFFLFPNPDFLAQLNLICRKMSFWWFRMVIWKECMLGRAPTSVGNNRVSAIKVDGTDFHLRWSLTDPFVRLPILILIPFLSLSLSLFSLCLPHSDSHCLLFSCFSRVSFPQTFIPLL